MLITIVIYAVAHFVLTRTVFGRVTYAIGGNEEAARLSGVPVRAYKTAVYGVAGLASAAAAVVLTARLNSAQPTAGTMYELDAIAATVIGGSSLLGGEGSLTGTLIGALIMGVLRNGLNLLNVSSFLQQVVIGVVIIGAVLVRHGTEAARIARAGRTVIAGGSAMTRGCGLLAMSRRPRLNAGCSMKVRSAWVLAVALAIAGDGLDLDGRAAAPRVAFVMKTLNHPFFLDMQRGAQDAAGPRGLDVVVQAAEREIDVEKQVQIIENLLQTGIRALIVTPSGSREIATVIAKANRANVPVIVVDTRVDPKAAADNQLKLASFIGSDNYEGGRIAGEYLAKVSGGKAKVAVLEGIPGHETGDSRLRGFRDALARIPA